MDNVPEDEYRKSSQVQDDSSAEENAEEENNHIGEDSNEEDIPF